MQGDKGAGGLAKAPLGAVPDHGSADLAAGRESDADDG
jgi:hypothetical protein